MVPTSNVFSFVVDRLRMPVSASDLTAINNLLLDHRRWVKPAAKNEVLDVLDHSCVVVVRNRTLGNEIVGMVVLCPVVYFSLRQVLVRDYCVFRWLGADGLTVRGLLEAEINRYAAAQHLTQGFLTNSDPKEQVVLEQLGWRKINTTAYIKDYA